MSQLPCASLNGVVTNGVQRNNFKPRPFKTVPCAYFSGKQGMNEFNFNLDDYISYNNMQEKNISSAKMLIKGWCTVTGGKYRKIFDERLSQQYKQSILELEKAFLSVRDKSALYREFFCSKQTIFEKASKFYLNKLYLKQTLGLQLTFDEIVEIVLSLLHINIQDYGEMCAPKNLNYTNCYWNMSTDRAEMDSLWQSFS